MSSRTSRIPWPVLLTCSRVLICGLPQAPLFVACLIAGNRSVGRPCGSLWLRAWTSLFFFSAVF